MDQQVSVVDHMPLSIGNTPNWQVEKAITALKIHPTLRTLLHVLVSYRNHKDEYSIFPRLSVLAEKMALGIRQTRRLISSLEEDGFIQVRDCYQRGDNSQGANIYIFLERILTPFNVPLPMKPRLSKMLWQKKRFKEIEGECLEPIRYMYTKTGKRLTLVSSQCPGGGDMHDRLNTLHNNHEAKSISNTTNYTPLESPLQAEAKEELKTNDLGISGNLADECLEVYAAEFEQMIPPTVRAKFKTAFYLNGGSKNPDKIKADFKTLASDPLWRVTTFSPNRVFAINTLKPIHRKVLSEIRTITESHKSSLIGFSQSRWSRSIIESEIISRWFAGLTEGILKACWEVAFGVRAETPPSELHRQPQPESARPRSRFGF